MYLIAVGINHRTAPVEVRERLAFGRNSLQVAVQEIGGLTGLDGFVILSTCNRTEIYAESSYSYQGVDLLKRYLGGKAGLTEDEQDAYLQSWTGVHAVEHLFRVASGLDSMILGETEILGQVRDAYETACMLRTGSSTLNVLFQEAIRTGKKVRSLTGIDRHPTSVSYAAVELARQVLGGKLDNSTVLIIGAGEMGELTLKHLVSHGASTVLVSNRSFERAEALAGEYGGEAIKFDQLFDHLNRADIVISCTAAAHFVITAERVRRAVAGRSGRPLLFIDIAVPRDVDPEVAELSGVHLYDIDDLQQVIFEHMEERRKAACAAEQLVKEAVDLFRDWLGTLPLVPVIKALQQKGDEIKDAELRRCLNRLGSVDPRTEKLIRTLAHSLTRKLLHTPIVRLKEYAQREEGMLYSRAICALFDLDVDQDDGNMKAGSILPVSEGTK